MAAATTATSTMPAQPVYNFAFNDFLQREYQFTVNDRRPFCNEYEATGYCRLGNECPNKHPPRYSDRDMVCKHWLRGLCKMGNSCDFEHEYNVRAHPECPRWIKHLSCDRGDDCAFQHPDPLRRRKPCPHYENGFCALGPRCAKLHVRRPLCPCYLAGFCPRGRYCPDGSHPKFSEDGDLPRLEARVEFSKEGAERERERLREARRPANRDDDSAYRADGQRGGRGGRGGRGRWQAKRAY